MSLLEVKSLKTYYFTQEGVVRAVDGVSFHVNKGEIVALVGESGCGKTVSMLSVLCLIKMPGRIVEGEILFNGVNLLKCNESEMRKIRGCAISMVFQEPSVSFDPISTVGNQIVETIQQHQNIGRQAALEKATGLLETVNIPDASMRMNNYPFEFSGGMLQRIMITLALSCDPQVLIADEPTTALDATAQAQVLEIMKAIVEKFNIALILITHNLGLVARYCDRVYMMYAGNVVETAPMEELYANAKHPYTIGLWASVPRLDRSRKESRLVALDGEPPNLVKAIRGCPFSPRCKESIAKCFEEAPTLTAINDSHYVACHLVSSQLS
ncbi:ABC transporter ATP-binding protein [Chloroflexota bacterium]